MTSQNSENLDKARRRLYSVLSVCAFVTFAVLLSVRLGRIPFWNDELYTRGFIESLKQIHSDAFHPSGYYLLLYGWKQILGDGDTALRAFSVLWGLVAFVLASAIGRRTLRPSQVVLAEWLIALSPFIILYFRMARYYSMTAAMALLVVYCAILVAQRGLARHWILLPLVCAGLVGTDYFATAMLLPLFVWLFVVALRRGQVLHFAASSVATAAFAAVMLRRVIWGVEGLSRVSSEWGMDISATDVLMRLFLPVYSLAIGETTFPWRIYITIPALAAVVCALVVGLLAQRSRRGIGVVKWGWVLSVLVVCFVLSVFARHQVLSAAARLSIFAAPLGYLTIAVGITRIRRRTLRAAALAILLVSNVYGLTNYFTQRQFLNPNYIVPWRSIVRTIAERSHPADRVISYEATITEYGDIPDFAGVSVERPPEEWSKMLRWPENGGRLWMVARDRGAMHTRLQQNELVENLRRHAAETEVFGFMAYGDLERRMRSLLLRREVPEYYITLYLFEPPDNGG
ncbi:MAG: glycosyltransferase family 39 protein [Armatimonadota bacterium]